MAIYQYTNVGPTLVSIGAYAFGPGQSKVFTVTQPVLDAVLLTGGTQVISRTLNGVAANNPALDSLSIDGATIGGVTPAAGTFTNATTTGYVIEAAQNNITATSAGTQATAALLGAQTNRVTIVATRGDAVRLPASAPGIIVLVVNDGANPMQVFPAVGDAINGQAANASVLQMQSSIDVYGCTVAGKWHAEVGSGYSGSFMTELTDPAITATPGGTQGTAYQINSQTSRVIVVATRGDAVKLPPSAAGLELVLINAGANPMQVFPNTGDAINGQVANASVLQMQNSIDVFACGANGQWSAEVGGGYAGSFITEISEDNITAFAGGGQATARLLTSQTSKITVVATAGDSIKLPPSAAGLELMVINKGGNPMQVFGSGTDLIDDIATGTGVSQMSNSLVIYTCATSGNWYSEGLATGFGGPGLQTQSYANGLTATGTNQATALVLSTMMSRITTTALNTGVALPASVSGLVIMVTNRGANPLNIYGYGADLVNGAAFIAIPVNSTAVFVAAVVGQWECEGVGAGFSGNLPTVSTTNAITAFAGGGQASAVLLTTVINRVTVVATAGDSIKLPPAVAGLQVTVYNAGVNSANVFPNTGDAINALAANTAFALVAGKNSTFGSAVNGSWHAILSA